MKIYSVYFDYFKMNVYDILAQVLEYSLKTNCPSAQIEIHKEKTPLLNHDQSVKQRGGSYRACVSNTVKLEKWLEVVKNTDDNVILMDSDMLVLGDLSEAFKHDFDIGITQRTRNVQCRMPYNGGVVFVKNTEAAKEFIELWDKINKKLFLNPQEHLKWRGKYAGMNQSAYGYIVNKEKFNAKIKYLPCSVWNACREDWPAIDNKTKIVHIKSGLRSAIIRNHPDTITKRAYTIWHEYAEKAGVVTSFTIGRADKPKQVFNFPKNKNGIKLYTYENYDYYVACQKKASEAKKGLTWTIEENIKFLCDNYIGLRYKHDVSGMCHGVRNGNEVKWFKKYLPKSKVIGTEIGNHAKDNKDVIIWDFNKENPGWNGKFDFIYSNSFDHAYDPQKTMLIWLKTLKKNGVLILEHTLKHETHYPDTVDCFAYSIADLINYVKNWTDSKFHVTRKLETPMNKRIKNADCKVTFVIIERTSK